MNILNFIVTYWDCLLTIIGLLVGSILAIKKGETKIINAFLLNLVTEAEKQFGTGTGALKKATVIKWVYERLPGVVKLLFSEKNISELVEYALEGAKLKWASNASLQAYISAGPEVDSIK